MREFRRMMMTSVLALAACTSPSMTGPPEQVATTDPARPGDDSPSALEARSLSDVRQITFSHMGLKQAGEGYFSPDGRTIIFQAVPDGREHYQIYTLALGDPAPKLVSTGKGECTCAYFRPDGKKVIFASSHRDPRLKDGQADPSPPQGAAPGSSKYTWHKNPHMDIFEADPDGSNLKRLTDADGYDAEGSYSPDGKQIVFASDRTGSMEIYLMQADGSDVRRLTETKDVYNGGPFISPDGNRIIYRADPQQKDFLQVFMMGVDGANRVQLTDEPGVVNWAPFWHPNGRTIVFTSSGLRHTYELNLLNVETKQRYPLTHHPKPDVLPVFSPDGNKLMWTSKRSDDGSSQLFIADIKLPDGFDSPLTGQSEPVGRR